MEFDQHKSLNMLFWKANLVQWGKISKFHLKPNLIPACSMNQRDMCGGCQITYPTQELQEEKKTGRWYVGTRYSNINPNLDTLTHWIIDIQIYRIGHLRNYKIVRFTPKFAIFYPKMLTSPKIDHKIFWETCLFVHL